MSGPRVGSFRWTGPDSVDIYNSLGGYLTGCNSVTAAWVDEQGVHVIQAGRELLFNQW